MNDAIKVWDGVLSEGGHEEWERKRCVMEAVAFVAGEPHSAEPKCASPCLTYMMQVYNDALASDAERKRKLSKYVYRLVGSRCPELEETRRQMALRWQARSWLVTIIKLACPEAKDLLTRAGRFVGVYDELEALVVEVIERLNCPYKWHPRPATMFDITYQVTEAYDDENYSWIQLLDHVYYCCSEARFHEVAKRLERSLRRLLDRMIRLTEPKEDEMAGSRAKRYLISERERARDPASKMTV
jgi:hypothetical protein